APAFGRFVIPASRSPLRSRFPTYCPVDGLMVDLHPAPYLQQPLFHDRGYLPMRIRADVEQEIPAAADLIDELQHQRLRGIIIPGVFRPVVTVGVTHPSALLEIMILEIQVRLVFWRIYTTVMEPDPAAPAVIGDDTVLNRALVIQPCQEFPAAESRVAVLPVPVGPEYIGPVGRNEVFHLRPHIVPDIPRSVMQPQGVVPFVQRIIHPG